MDTTLKIYELLAKRTLDQVNNHVLIDWAVESLVLGLETESLSILAGLDRESNETIAFYFWKSVKELHLTISKDENIIVNEYAKQIAQAVLDEQLDVESGLKTMNRICRWANYESRYIHFHELHEDINYLKCDVGFSPIYNKSLTKENSNHYAIRVFQLFITIEKLGLHEFLGSKIFCNTCKLIANPLARIKIQWKRPFIIKENVCENCKSTNFDSYRTIEGREKMLKDKAF